MRTNEECGGGMRSYEELGLGRWIEERRVKRRNEEG
jgi:hypothetical protein